MMALAVIGGDQGREFLETARPGVQGLSAWFEPELHPVRKGLSDKDGNTYLPACGE